MAQPCVKATKVRQSNPHAGLGLPTPGSEEKTQAHQVPYSTSEKKATIRVSRSIALCLMGCWRGEKETETEGDRKRKTETESGSGPMDRGKSEETRKEASRLRG